MSERPRPPRWRRVDSFGEGAALHALPALSPTILTIHGPPEATFAGLLTREGPQPPVGKPLAGGLYESAPTMGSEAPTIASELESVVDETGGRKRHCRQHEGICALRPQGDARPRARSVSDTLAATASHCSL